MSVYRRYASGEHDKEFFNDTQNTHSMLRHSSNSSAMANDSLIELYPLNGQFKTVESDNSMFHISMADWNSIFENASYFVGFDSSVFGNIITMVFKNLNSGKICTRSFTKYGFTLYDDLIIDPRSRFWPACENLTPELRHSKTRKALAISNLKNYSKISNNHGILKIDSHWDETNAGSLANSMTQIKLDSPQEFGNLLNQLGLLQSHTINTFLLDVVYDKNNSDERINQENIKLFELLGEQIDHVFDPLLEYSPESMEISYQTPETKPSTNLNDHLVDSIVGELISVQTNYTMGLVNLLQNFIIPLRINVLESTDKAGISKLNRIFPPTTDEITRINCILHDALSRAQEYGCTEIFKALAIILPYFYKPFIRHEANLKHFSSRVNKFYTRHKERVFENANVNQGGYSLREIESIVRGTLAELPKLKMIIKRLFDNVIELQDTNPLEVEEIESIRANFNIAIGVIDAFGIENPTEQVDSKNRVFTPTGKILTELAFNWPAELQYGWLTRKVVDIFEFKNLKPVKDTSPIEVLVIFSDHLLFLNILDTNYGNQDNNLKIISVKDLLMHSLVNEKPIPNLAQFPSMKVSCWCDISDIIVSSYSSNDSNLKEYHLKFLSTSENGFSVREGSDPIHSKSYQTLDNKENKQAVNHNIITLINKSKILHKTQPLHLFKLEDRDFCLYSAAHEMTAYEQETSKSPFTLFLNGSLDDPVEYLRSNSSLQLLINANYIGEETIQISAFGKSGDYRITQIIHHNKFESFIKDMISANLHLYMRYDKYVVNSFISATSSDLKFVIDKFSTIVSNNAKYKQAKIEETHKASSEKSAVEPQKPAMDNSIQEKKALLIQNKHKRKSFLQVLLKPFKKQKHDDVKIVDTNCTNNVIPKGEVLEVHHLYLPMPELENVHSVIVHDTLANPLKQLSDAAVPEDVPEQEQLAHTELSIDLESTLGPKQSGKNLKQPLESIGKIHTERAVINSPINQNLDSVQSKPEASTKKNYASSISEVDLLAKDDGLPDIQLNPFELKQLYSDGVSNWVPIIRDNSSLFAQEVRKVSNKSERAKDSRQEKKSDLTDILQPCDEGESTSFAQEVVAQFEEEFDEFEFTKETNERKEDGKYFVKENKEESMQSLTPSMYANNFEKEIERTFSSSRLMDTIEEFKFEIETPSFSHWVHSNQSASSFESTDNEFYSPDEYAYNEPQHGYYAGSPISVNSDSSEATIINEQTNSFATSAQDSDKLELPPSRIVSGNLRQINIVDLSNKFLGRLRLTSDNEHR